MQQLTCPVCFTEVAEKVDQDTSVYTLAGKLGHQLLTSRYFSFGIAGACGLKHLQRQLLVTRQTRLVLTDLDFKLIAAPQVTLKTVLTGKTQFREGELRIQAHRLLQLTNGIASQITTAIVHAQLVMAIGFDVGGGSLLDLRRFLRLSGCRQKAAGDIRSKAIYHPEDALHILPLELVGEQDLPGARILRAHVEPQLRRANL